MYWWLCVDTDSQVAYMVELPPKKLKASVIDSLRSLASVHDQACSGNERRLTRSQQQRRFRDLFWLR